MTEQTKPTVHEAWAAVMADVRGLAKGQRNTAPGGGYAFRGIDAVMNAVGPALRSHGVAVVPRVTATNYRDVQTSKGKASREATVLVDFTVYGPAGDHFTGAAPGEAMDHGDKGTAKAMSVAMRTFLLQSLCLPTDEPDPDAETFERDPGPTPQQKAQQAADGLPGCVDHGRLTAVRAWADQNGVMDVPVTDEHGNSLPLRDLFIRHSERLQGADDPAA